MIVCKNCKTQNPSTALKCGKCNAPFDGSLALRAPEKPNINATSQLHPSGQGWTIRDCPSCGYPNKSISDDCVSCGESLYPTLNLKKQPADEVQPVMHAHTPKSSPDPVSAPIQSENSEVSKMSRTVNPWIEPEPDSLKFTLEMLDTDYSSLNRKLEFEGEEISLNRLNLESENSTITQKTQAVITRQNGGWKLTDQSDMKTTFIKPEAGHTLKDGDILLMGNRLFRFTEVR